jgi:hypothetical protein
LRRAAFDAASFGAAGPTTMLTGGPLSKRLLACPLALLLLLTLAHDWRASGAAGPRLESLATLFDVKLGLVRDTNGDSLADSVAARVIVPAEPGADDLEAAANIAARLSYETTAMTLPLVLRDDHVTSPEGIALPILVGRENRFVKKLVESQAIDVKSLAPGQGLIALVRSAAGGPDGVVVVGGDDAGTLAAGVELAARLPRLWNMTGITLAGIEQQAAQYLRAKGVADARASVISVLVDSDRRGIATVTLEVSSGGDRTRIVKIFEDLDAAHRAGREPKVLNFAEAASTTVRVNGPGGAAGAPRASVRRTGMNARTLTPPVDPDEFVPEPPAGGDRAGASGERAAAVAEPPAAAAEAAGAAAVSGGGRAGAAPAAATPAPAGQRGGAPSASTPAPAPAAAPATPSAPAKPFDLSGVYSLDGWLGDAYQDLIPDRVETSLILGGPRDSFGATHIAARLGLESTGITLPLTKRDEKVKQPQSEPSPILVGRDNRLVQQLLKIGKARVDDLQPGEGAIQIVPRAFGNATATVVAGADPAGTEGASMHLARRVPYVWDVRRGAPSLDDVVTEATRFFGARSGASHAAQALGELKGVLDDLREKKLESIDAKVFLEKADPLFAKFFENEIRHQLEEVPDAKDAKVAVATQGVTDPVTVFEDKLDIPWEVDEFWAKVKSEVLPKVKAGAKVELEARLSEPPEVRTEIAGKARADLSKAGAANPRVRILSAYKQGFFWLTEQVLPELKGKHVRSVNVIVRAHKPDLSKKYKFYQVPSRWLQELFPADEIFKRDLGLPLDAFRMELADETKDIYRLEAKDAGGKVVYASAFSPTIVEREYLDKFPGWAKVDVTTGWLSATVDGQSAVDVRIQTDPERFWDHYQSKILPRVYDNVMRVTGSRPTSDKQPFFRDFDVEVWMSEPDFRLGIDEEQVSSLESLHEDIYFVTLDFFAAMGRTLTRNRLNSPGKVLPIIHPARPGKAGEARILYAGNAATRAKMDITYKEKGVEKPTIVSRDLGRINVSAPQIVREVARADRLTELEIQVDAADDREAGRAADALDNLVRLQAAGLFKTAFSYDHVDRVAVNIGLRDARTRRVVRNTGSFAPSDIRSAAGAADVAPASRPADPDNRSSHSGPPRSPIPDSDKHLIEWDHVIGPDEAEQLVSKLAAYPEIEAYKVGESYRGRDLSLMEVTLPTSSELVSIAKLTAYKPTIFIMGRQHANEVSSTSHILRLAELLATDATYRKMLEKVNVILCPVQNPDGAAISFELQKLTPNHMLHAGRYSALGSDVGSSTLLPESEVVGRVWREWLPDIYLNPHGYPSHEWVQQFAGYVPPGFRAYWDSRGWYTLMQNGLRDPRYPDYEQANLALREAIVREINANADVHAMNVRHQDRYTRWAYGFGPHVYTMEVYKDTTIFFSDPESGEPRGSRRAAGASGAGGSSRRATMGSWPQVTLVGGTTEAPDETAQGPWMNLVTKAGFSFLMAHVDYLKDGRYQIQRIEEGGQRDNATITTLRVRPVMPARAVAARPRRPTM